MIQNLLIQWWCYWLGYIYQDYRNRIESRSKSHPTILHTVWYVHFCTSRWGETQDDSTSEKNHSEQRITCPNGPWHILGMLSSPRTKPLLGSEQLGNKGEFLQQCWRQTGWKHGKTIITRESSVKNMSVRFPLCGCACGLKFISKDCFLYSSSPTDCRTSSQQSDLRDPSERFALAGCKSPFTELVSWVGM